MSPRVLLITAALALSACETFSIIRPPPSMVGGADEASEGRGYIAALFTADDQNDRSAYVLTNGWGADFYLPVRDPSRSGSLPETRVTMIEVPPGEYRITGWMQNVRTIAKKGEIQGGGPFVEPFTVKDGCVAMLGYLHPRVGGKHRKREILKEIITTTWLLGPEPIGLDVARRGLADAYPGFAATPARCLFCGAGH
jgi:hypothetical protein